MTDDLSQYLRAKRALVEGALDAALRPEEGCPAPLREAMRYSLLAPGKRVRPLLVLLSAEAAGGSDVGAMPAACAAEMIHAYSLVHDDLPAMDDDDLRRGRPTCHVRYGEDVAILAGDGLYAEAFRLALHAQEGEAADVLAAVSELADATGVNGMVGGQYIDVRGIAEGSEPGLRRMHELKTGRLIGASVECVLLLTGVRDPSPTLSAFRAFAAELGVLFQIVDDILDVTGTDAALGKPQGSDERHGKLTYVTRFGLDGARAMAGESHRNAHAALSRATAGAGAAELEQITDFIANRTS